MTRWAIIIWALAAVALVACGETADVDARADGTDADTAGPGAPAMGVPANGGLSVEEAKASGLEGPLAVAGFIVADEEGILLCDALAESFPPQCGGASLVVEGLDLDAHDTRQDGETRWTDSPVTVLGHVEGETLYVSDTAA